MPPPKGPDAAAGAAIDMLGSLLGKLDADQLEAVLALAPAAMKAAELFKQMQQERAALAKERTEIEHARAVLARERAVLARERATLAKERTDARESSRVDVVKLDEQGRILFPPRITYAWCCAFRAAPPEVQKQLSHMRRSQYKRAAQLLPEQGQALDSAGIAFCWIRFIAYGVDAHEQQARLEQILRDERPKRVPPGKRAAPPRGKRRGRPPGAKTRRGARSP